MRNCKSGQTAHKYCQKSLFKIGTCCIFNAVLGFLFAMTQSVGGEMRCNFVVFMIVPLHRVVSLYAWSVATGKELQTETGLRQKVRQV